MQYIIYTVYYTSMQYIGIPIGITKNELDCHLENKLFKYRPQDHI